MKWAIIILLASSCVDSRKIVDTRCYDGRIFVKYEGETLYTRNTNYDPIECVDPASRELRSQQMREMIIQTGEHR